MNPWIKAARLRTIPLSISGIIVGISLSFPESKHKWHIALFCVLIAIILQILSNYANDYGDFIKGTDNENRKGPKRTLQEGLLTPKQIKTALYFVSFLALGLTIITLFLAFGNDWQSILIFIGMCLIAILAAIGYTVGKNAYGYKGLGDLFVFLFFGLMSVLGTKFVITQNLDWKDLLPAISVGLFSTAVLNLNNMRDIENDIASKKYTLVTKLGLENAIKYHYALIIGGILIFLFFLLIGESTVIYFLPCLAFILFIKHLLKIAKNGTKTNFDPELKVVALSTFLWSVLFLISLF